MPAAADARVARLTKEFACASVPLTAALAKQYELDGDAYVLLLDPEGAVLDKFESGATPEKLIAAMKGRVVDARAELRKSAGPEADAKARKAALTGLVRLGPVAEDLVPFLTDPDTAVRDAARKARSAMPPEASMTALLMEALLKSEDAALRTAAHPLAVHATGYKGAPLKVFQSGTAEERAAAWDKWNEVVQTQFPPLNRAVAAYCRVQPRRTGDQRRVLGAGVRGLQGVQGPADGDQRKDVHLGSRGQVRRSGAARRRDPVRGREDRATSPTRTTPPSSARCSRPGSTRRSNRM